jgi:hypothetical protein
MTLGTPTVLPHHNSGRIRMSRNCQLKTLKPKREKRCVLACLSLYPHRALQSGHRGKQRNKNIKLNHNQLASFDVARCSSGKIVRCGVNLMLPHVALCESATRKTMHLEIPVSIFDNVLPAWLHHNFIWRCLAYSTAKGEARHIKP